MLQRYRRKLEVIFFIAGENTPLDPRQFSLDPRHSTLDPRQKPTLATKKSSHSGWSLTGGSTEGNSFLRESAVY